MAKGAAAMKASVRASSRWVTFFSTSSRGVSYSASELVEGGDGEGVGEPVRSGRAMARSR